MQGRRTPRRRKWVYMDAEAAEEEDQRHMPRTDGGPCSSEGRAGLLCFVSRPDKHDYLMRRRLLHLSAGRQLRERHEVNVRRGDAGALDACLRRWPWRVS